jgi:hypothetical protein
MTVGKFDEAEVLARADNMCTNRQTLIRNRFIAYKAEHPGASRAKLISGASYSLILPGIQFMFDDLHIMGAPEGDEEQIEGIIGTMQYAIETGQKRYPRSARQLGHLFRNFNRLAVAYGFDQCTVDRAHYPVIWAAG